MYRRQPPKDAPPKRSWKHRLIGAGYRLIEPLRLGYRWVRRPLSVGVRGLVVNERGEVLLVRHTYLEGWYFPGGGVKRRESVLQGLERELDEEVGVTFSELPELFGIYSNSIGYRSDHVALFVVRAYDHRPRENIEIAEWGFFAIDDLPAGVAGGTRNRLLEFQGRQPRVFDW